MQCVYISRDLNLLSTPKLADSLGCATHGMIGAGGYGSGITKAFLPLFLDDFFGDHIREFFPLFDTEAFFLGMDRQTSSQSRNTNEEHTQ
jgi:hypothetical protein